MVKTALFIPAMHKLYRHILANNTADLSGYTKLLIGGQALGYLHSDIAGALENSKHVRHEGAALCLAQDNNFESRNQNLKAILALLVEKKLIASERFELYAVANSFGEKPLALADRALMPALGLPAHGIHCDGYVRMAQNIKIWIGKRSATAHVDPHKLDHLVAGGQPYGLTLEENLAKEASEEANIPKALAARAKATGIIRYNKAIPHGVRRDTLFTFELELPEDFIPENTDGEASGFELMDALEVRRLLEETDVFKFNVPLVLIDFLIRHGIIAPDESGFAALAEALYGEAA